MKNRFLPSGYLTALLGLTFLLFSALAMAGEPGSGDPLSKIRANQLTGKVNPQDVFKAQAMCQQSRTKATGGLGLDWQFMGPDNFAGTTLTVLFDNRDNTGSTIYTGGTNGGIWRSKNLGLTWHKMNGNSTEALRISSLAQTTDGIIYAGTGTTNCHEVANLGTGIYRSTDGENFTPIPATVLDPDFIAISKLIVDPRNNRIFAAAWGGLFYSDNGDTWSLIREGFASDVEVASDGTILTVIDDMVYIARGGNLGDMQLLSTGAQGMLPDTDVNWVQTAIAPSSPDIMYAAVVRADNNMKNIYRSGNKGNSWEVIFPYNPSFEPYNGKGCYSNTLVVYPNDPNSLLLGGVNLWRGQKFDDNGFFYWEQISYGNISELNTRFVPLYHHDYVFRPGHPAQFAVASDGGITIGTMSTNDFSFQTTNKNLAISHFHSVAFSRHLSYAMGGANRIGTQTLGYYFPSQVNNPSTGKQIWVNFGAFNDGGTGGFCTWSSINPNMTVFSKSDPITDETPIRRQELTDLTYTNDFIGTITNTNVARIPMAMWESFNFDETRDSVNFHNRSDSTVKAGTTLTIESNNAAFPFSYTLPVNVPAGDSLMIPDPVANRFFLSGTKGGYGVFMTKQTLRMDVVPQWFMVFKMPEGTFGKITAMTVSDNLNTMWLGTDAGYLFRVSNLILAYDSLTGDVNSATCIVANEKIDLPEIEGRYVTSIAIDPNDEKRVLVTLGNFGNANMLYYTANGLDSLPVFQNATGNLPPAPVYSGLIELGGSSRALVGTEFGVYTTANLGAANPVWFTDYLNLGDVPVMQLKQQTMNHYSIMNEGVIYAATYGSGIWMDTTQQIPVGIQPGTPPASGDANLKINPNPVLDKASVTWNGNGTPSRLMVYDISGRPVMTGTAGTSVRGEQTTTIDFSILPKGSYILRINSATAKFIKL